MIWRGWETKIQAINSVLPVKDPLSNNTVLSSASRARIDQERHRRSSTTIADCWNCSMINHVTGDSCSKILVHYDAVSNANSITRDSCINRFFLILLAKYKRFVRTIDSSFQWVWVISEPSSCPAVFRIWISREYFWLSAQNVHLDNQVCCLMYWCILRSVGIGKCIKVRKSTKDAEPRFYTNKSEKHNYEEMFIMKVTSNWYCSV